MSRIFMDSPDAAEQLTKKLNYLLQEKQIIKDREHKTWELTNIGATIRTVKKKLEVLQARAENGITLERRTTFAGNRKSFYYVQIDKEGNEIK